jgi:hypothetical protein
MVNTVNIAVESFQVATEQPLSEFEVVVSGVALPGGRVSRNGFAYIPESVEQAKDTLMGKPVLFNHDNNSVLGHVTNVGYENGDLTYSMVIDADCNLGWVATKMKRGHLKKVSIQAAYDSERSFIDEQGITHAYVTEFYELSVVTIPGFEDTTANVVEMLKDRKQSSEEVPMADDEKSGQDEQPKDTDLTKLEEYGAVLAKLREEVDELKKVVTSMQDDDTKSESDEEEPDEKKDDDKDDDKDKKIDEAISKNKVTVASEGFTAQPEKVITKHSLVSAFASMER